ncbi:Hypothetical predicted protein, partial [Paramuricea clavata]
MIWKKRKENMLSLNQRSWGTRETSTGFFQIRFFVLSGGYGQNAAAFHLATAFTVSRMIRNALNAKDVWKESSVGMIFSPPKCVGKSLSLYLLALGQGVPERVNLMFLRGGNQQLCGKS